MILTSLHIYYGQSGSKAQSTTTTLAESGPMMEKLEHLHQRVEAFKKASVIDDIQDAVCLGTA